MKRSARHHLAVLVGLLLLAALPARARYLPAAHDNPSREPGPAHAWGGSYSLPLSPAKAGLPRMEGMVNTFTGNVTIALELLSRAQLGGAPPFTLFYNSRPWLAGERSRPLGPLWTHSYNVRVVPHYEKGVWVAEGNGQVHFFTKTALGQGYVSPKGVDDALAETPGGEWALTRAGGETLTFDGSGALTRVRAAGGATWTLHYRTDGAPQLTELRGPRRQRVVLSYTYDAARHQHLLTRVTFGGGTVRFDYGRDAGQARGPERIITGGGRYALRYQGGQVAQVTDPSGTAVRYTYEEDELGVPRATRAAVTGPHLTQASARFTYRTVPTEGGGSELWVDIQVTRAGQQTALRHIYEADGGTGSMQGALLRVIDGPGPPPHRNATRAWSYDAQLRRSERAR